MATVDLNADLGESFAVWRLGDDEAMLNLVTSANVACGFHAGDPAGLARSCQDAAKRGVRIGARWATATWQDSAAATSTFTPTI